MLFRSRRETQVEKSRAIEARTIEALDSNRLIQRNKGKAPCHRGSFKMKTTIIFNNHAAKCAGRASRVQEGNSSLSSHFRNVP